MELLFKEENRVINRNQVEALKKSISAHGFIAGHPIIVNTKNEIIDGQHRYIACKELGVEPEIIVIGSGMDEQKIIIDLNIAQKSWTIDAFINYYAMLGNENYKLLQRFMNATKLGATVSLILLCGEAHTDGVFGSIKRGELVLMANEDAYRDALGKYYNLMTIAKLLKLPKPNKNLAIAYDRLMLIDEFDMPYLINKCKRYQSSLYICGSARAYLQMFLKIYNYHKRGNEILIGD